jgi:hypothetical protein
MSSSDFDPAILAHIPLAQPPLGVVPDFNNPVSQASIAAIAIYVTTPFMFVFVVLRIYTRITHFGAVGIDDCKPAMRFFGLSCQLGLISERP